MKNLDTPKDNRDKKFNVDIPVNGAIVEGVLRIPHTPRGIVLFAHGSGRHSPRNNYVAGVLRRARIATLLFDLLTEEEDLVYNRFAKTPPSQGGDEGEVRLHTSADNAGEAVVNLHTKKTADFQSAEVYKQSLKGNLLQAELTRFPYENRFNIELLTERLLNATRWVKKYPDTKDLRLGYFGASTGTASALKAAARIGSDIKAVVSRGGRPDLAMDEIEEVKASTLLIVGENDPEVVTLNQMAYEALNTTKKLEIVLGATHLFEEPGTLEKAAELASEWFRKYLGHGLKEPFRKEL